MKKKASDTIDVKALMALWMKHWWWFVISVGICLSIALFSIVRRDKEYLVEANVMMSSEDPMTGLSTDGASGGLAAIFGNGPKVDDEVIVMGSHEIMRRAVEALGLNTEYNLRIFPTKYRRVYGEDTPLTLTPVDSTIADTLRSVISFKVTVSADGLASVKAKVKRKTILKEKDLHLPALLNTPYGQFTLATTSSYVSGEKLKMSIGFRSYDAMAEKLGKDVNVGIVSRKSSAIELYTECPDIYAGMNLLNEIVAQYNQKGVNDRRAMTQATLDFIDNRAILLQRELESAEAGIETYKQNERMSDIEAETKYQFERRGLAEEKELDARSRLEILKMAKEFLADSSNNTKMMPLVVEDPSIAKIVEQYNELIGTRMKLAGGVKDGNHQLARIDRQAEATRQAIIQSIDRAASQAQSLLASMSGERKGAESRLGSVPRQERQYRSVARNRELLETIYLFLLQRREEVGMIQANSNSKAIIIDEAFAHADSTSMSGILILIIALVFGLAIPIVLLYVLGLFRNRFETVDELKRLTQVPVLGEVCNDKTGEEIVVRPGVVTSIAELFRLIRANLQFVLRGDKSRVVMLTSTRSGEGKTFVALNLASSLSLLDKRVVLIGADIRKPRLAQRLGIPDRRGLTDYLSLDTVTASDIIVKQPSGLRFDVILSGPVPPNPAELLLSDRFDQLVEKLKAEYDYVLIDSAPVGMVSDSFALDRLCDAVIYVCRANYTTTADVDFLNENVGGKRLNNVSLVVNGTKASRGYGYGYGEKK